MNFEFELTSTPLTSTAGLAFVGRQLEDPKFDRHLESLCPHQRSRGMPQKAGDAFRDFTTRLLRAHNGLLVEEHHGQSWLTVNIDVSPMDNSGSHKEGVSCTYKKFDGYAPIFPTPAPMGSCWVTSCGGARPTAIVKEPSSGLSKPFGGPKP
jgi:hypothetical protein